MKLDRKQLSSGEKESDYDLTPVTIRSISVIGALWPPCNRCRHIAQEHDEAGCGARVLGQCPSCHAWTENVKCGCKHYEGPTWEQFKSDYLTPEEIEFYKWDVRGPSHVK